MRNYVTKSEPNYIIKNSYHENYMISNLFDAKLDVFVAAG